MMVFFVDSSTNMNDERVFLVEQSGEGVHGLHNNSMGKTG